MIILTVGWKFLMEMTRMMLASSSESGELDSLLAKMRHASASFICVIYVMIAFMLALRTQICIGAKMLTLARSRSLRFMTLPSRNVT